VARRYAVVRPHLSEFQRRLWLGAEAAELGSGGVAVVAQATGVAADTVRRGRKEADAGSHPGAGRSRRAGGGRKRAEVHDETLVAAFESLIDPVTRGGACHSICVSPGWSIIGPPLGGAEGVFCDEDHAVAG